MKTWRILISEPTERFAISNSRRAKYFKKTDKASLPKKYSNKKRYKFVNNILIDLDSGDRVIRNSLSVGTPKYWKVNMNDIYSGNLHPQSRSKVAGMVHQYLKAHIKRQLPSKIELREGEYLSIRLEIFDSMVTSQFWDCDNKWLWNKWFQDTLTELKIIPDDDIRYIRSGGQTVYIEIPKGEGKAFRFVIDLITI